MIETIDGAMPPVTPCPSWCGDGFHAWEPDGDEWRREHSRQLAPDGADWSARLFTWDYFDGTGIIGDDPQIEVDGVLQVDDLQAVADVLRTMRGDPRAELP